MTIVLKDFIVLPPNNIVPFDKLDGDGIEVGVRDLSPPPLLPHIVYEALQAENGPH